MVSDVMPFFDCLKWILFSHVLTICMFDIRWKHTCLQTWKHSTYESKAYKHTKITFLQTRCTFSVRTASFLNEAPKEKSSCSSTFSDSRLFTMEAKNLHFLARFCYQHSLLLHKLLYALWNILHLQNINCNFCKFFSF